MNSFSTTVFLIVLNTAGIGFLYLPYTFQLVGVVWAAILVVISMASTLVGLDVINTLWHNARKPSEEPSDDEDDMLILRNTTDEVIPMNSEQMIKSYTELMRVHLDGKEKYVVDVIVSSFALLLTTLVPSLYIMFGVDIVADIAITFKPDTPADKTWIMIAMVSFEFGMVMSSNWVMNQIKLWVSRLTMLSLALFSVCLIYYAADMGFEKSPAHLYDTVENDRLFQRVMHVFLAYLASFFYTLQVPEIALGMKNHSPIMVTTSQVVGILICGFFSYFVGAFGFFVFGNTTLDPNIINNLPNGAFTCIVRGFILVTILVLSAIYIRLSVSLFREILRTFVDKLFSDTQRNTTTYEAPRINSSFGFSASRREVLRNAISKTDDLRVKGGDGLLHKDLFTGFLRVMSIGVMVVILVAKPDISSIFSWIGSYSLVHLTTSVPAYVLLRSKHVTFQDYPIRHIVAILSIMFGIGITVISIVLETRT